MTDFWNRAGEFFQLKPEFSNDFVFNQSIHQVRAALTYDFPKKLRLITGIQAEYTDLRFDFTSGLPDTRNDYFNLLPHLTLRKDWKNKWNGSIVYRRNIRRPGINELNPSIDFNDPYNLRFGNPRLQPQMADNFDLNAGLNKGKFFINSSIGYNYVKDIIQSIRTLIPGNKTQVTFQNITDRQEYEASLWGGYTFSKKLRMNASSGYTYNVYSEFDRLVNKYRNGGSFNSSLGGNLTVNNRVTVEGQIRYSSIADAQGRSRSNISQNLGLQTKWLNKQLTMSLALIDFISRQQFNTTTVGSNFTIESMSSARTRNVRLSMAYNLKKTALTPKKLGIK